ncbi:MAG: fumarylacetoacetate hydrolase family protein [Caulobacter sp.]|nr:fumarylacetoacetate hydrolase family protein [Caulobacter sp.]
MANIDDILPDDGFAGVLVGRIWIDGATPGPRPVAVRREGLFDLSALAPTLSDLFDLANPAGQVARHEGPCLATLQEAADQGLLLAPCDLQAIKAAGVTFADSLIERVIEERARGDAAEADAIRLDLAKAVGSELTGVRPGSPEAEALKRALIAAGLWSQYLEVGIGPDAEVFTKAQPMSAVGWGARIGVHPKSMWNNPEPEIVLACASDGTVVGATLGNDVNLRDFEGRSALLLSKAKDNNASCAIGPFVRLFDETFSLEDVRAAELGLTVNGRDGFLLSGASSMHRISRDPLDLVAQTLNAEHQYPDGFMLFLGTLFAPTQDRGAPGAGFTHAVGDMVCIRSSRLGSLVNEVTTSDLAPPWRFGARALMRSLGARGLL